MSLSFKKSDPVDIELEWVRDVERVAYTLLESARMRCEWLSRGPIRSSELQQVHSDLGLAGFHVSNELPADVRAHCLKVARDESESGLRGSRTLTLATMFEEALTAADTIAAALPHVVGDHMQMAHEYAVSACESLDERLADADAEPS
jgi:hypothetical protein